MGKKLNRKIPLMWRVKNLNVDNFATKKGIKFRRAINPYIKGLMKYSTPYRLAVNETKGVNRDQLDKDEAYIFSSNHYFKDDVLAPINAIPNHAYILWGATTTLEYCPEMYPVWVNGLIYIDRENKESRRSSVDKQIKVLENGSSVLIYPEGSYNNSPNKLIKTLFKGPYILSQKTGKDVVPVVSYRVDDTMTIYTDYGRRINAKDKTADEFIKELRDEMATIHYLQIEQHGISLKRDELPDDTHMYYNDYRKKKEYDDGYYTYDRIDEETTTYKPRDIVDYEDVWGFLDNVELNERNAKYLAEQSNELKRVRKRKFRNYLKENWDK